MTSLSSNSIDLKYDFDKFDINSWLHFDFAKEPVISDQVFDDDTNGISLFGSGYDLDNGDGLFVNYVLKGTGLEYRVVEISDDNDTGSYSLYYDEKNHISSYHYFGRYYSKPGEKDIGIYYYANGNVSECSVTYDLGNGELYVVYDPRGNIKQARYSAYRNGVWGTDYYWFSLENTWFDSEGNDASAVITINPYDYPFAHDFGLGGPTVTPVPTEECEPEQPTEQPMATLEPEAPSDPASGSATLDNAYGKMAIVDENGELVDYTGFEKFEGADFYFEHGIIRDDMDGLTLIDGTWYNMQQGRFNTADGMVFFEGATFLVKGGVIDETQSGLIEYDGQRFVFSYGQFVSSLYGAWPDPISGRFVYVWAGQFYPITDLVSYDGQVFYFINGYLATDFVGTVYDFNGTPFNIIYGQAY